MTDIESEVFALTADAVHESYPDLYITGEKVRTPKSLPCVMLVEQENVPYRKMQTSSKAEGYSQVMYECNVFSNRHVGRKKECRDIINIIDNALQAIGLTRIMLSPITNLEDDSIYQMIARYQGVVDENKMIYRR